jgi:hypothetical protein
VYYAKRNDKKLRRLSCPISLDKCSTDVSKSASHSFNRSNSEGSMNAMQRSDSSTSGASDSTSSDTASKVYLGIMNSNQTTWSIENPSFPSYKQWETPLVHLSVSWTILQPMSLVKRTMPWWVLQVQINSYLMRQTIWATQSTWNVSKVEDIADQNLAAIGGFNDKERSEIDKIAKDSERRKWYNDWDQ